MRVIESIGLFSIGFLIGAVGTALAIQQYDVKVSKRKRCNGYTKIEYGKGIDCYGDTIRIKEHNELYKEYLNREHQ